MKYSMTEPCDACPFLRDSGFTFIGLLGHASGEFACHKTCKLEKNEDGFESYQPRNENTPHCAGALIFNEKRNQPHQMARICERLGIYDHRKLNMKANVGSKPEDYREPDEYDRKRYARAERADRRQDRRRDG